ncbi:MAG: hypothetical protein WA964_03265 [Ilumatobacter sp.]|uniref:hypothetical protein n=1 Tax=Ilumatobacter sp. TaxID=1967498 RepID=UPI003C73E3E7
MTPSTPPLGLRLVSERRQLIADCGPLDDCLGTIPFAGLQFDTDDPTTARTLFLWMQGEPTERAETIGPAPVGNTIQIRDRAVVIEAVDVEASAWHARWTDPAGYIVDIRATGLSEEQLIDFVGSLTATSPDAWPNGPIEPPAGRCVDDRTRAAPTFQDEGWSRHIIEAAPVDGCDAGVFLFMSFVAPSDVLGGGLVTIVTQPALGSSVQPGDPIVIDGNLGTISGPDPLGPAQSHPITFVSDALFVDVHGTAPVETLVRIAESIEPVDEATWAEIVASIDTP